MGFSETLVKIIFWSRVRKAKQIGAAAELIGEGRAEETLEILSGMERRIPPYVGHLFFLTKARALDDLGRLKEAEDAYLAAVFAKEGLSTAYIHLAVLCGRQRRFDDARDWLRRMQEVGEAVEADETTQELLEQASELAQMLDDVESGKRLADMHERAQRFALSRGVVDQEPSEALCHLEEWVGANSSEAQNERDELACYLGELAISAMEAHWVISLSLEESYVEAGEWERNPFDWVASRLSGEVLVEDFFDGLE